jgi:uncharacterized membrane protein
MTTANNPADEATAKLIYILYLVTLVAGVTSLIGVIMAYVNRSDAPVWVQSHYQFQIRTFWIGLLYFSVSSVALMFLIGFVLLPLSTIWWIVRCVKGLQATSSGVPYPNATSWLW